MRTTRYLGLTLAAAAAMSALPGTIAHAAPMPELQAATPVAQSASLVTTAASTDNCAHQTLYTVAGTKGNRHLYRMDNSKPSENYWATQDGDLSRGEVWDTVKFMGIDGSGTTKRLLVNFDSPNLDDKLVAYNYSDSTPKQIGNGETVLTGIRDYRSLTSAGNGTLWGLDASGKLFSFRFDATKKQYVRGAQPIASEWGAFSEITAGDDGTIFARTTANKLLRYHYTKADGTTGGKWDVLSDQVSGDWSAIRHSTGGGRGLVYGLTTSGTVSGYDFNDGGRGEHVKTPADTFRIAADPTACGPVARPVDANDAIRAKIGKAAYSVEGLTESQFCKRGDVTCLAHYWCQDFIWWTWRQAGVPHATEATNQSVDGFYNEYVAKGWGRMFTDSKQLKVGDVVVWTTKPATGGRTSDSRHVAMVSSVANGKVMLMHGNYKPNGATESSVHEWSLEGSLDYIGPASYFVSPFKN